MVEMSEEMRKPMPGDICKRKNGGISTVIRINRISGNFAYVFFTAFLILPSEKELIEFFERVERYGTSEKEISLEYLVGEFTPLYRYQQNKPLQNHPLTAIFK
jgi:hypothetical protein